jgi:hypothetical protein
MENNFVKFPIILHIVKFINNSPIINKTIIFVGDVSDDILKILKNTKKSKADLTKLKSFYGSRIVNIISKSGGDEYDDLLANLDISLEDIQHSKDTGVEKKFDYEGSDAQKHKDTKNIYYSSLSIFPEDTITDFRQKIFLETGIELPNQHIYIINQYNKIFPIGYTLMHDNIYLVNITTLYQNSTEQIPTDKKLIKIVDDIRVFTYDEFESIDSLTSYSKGVYYVVDMEDFFQNKAQLELSKVRLEQIYNGFVLKYYPMYSFELFQEFISSNDYKSKYPQLYFERDYLRNSIVSSSKVINEFYKKWPKVEKEIKSSYYVKFGKVLVETDENEFNLRDLIDSITLSDKIVHIQARIDYEGNVYEITKYGNIQYNFLMIYKDYQINNAIHIVFRDLDYNLFITLNLYKTKYVIYSNLNQYNLNFLEVLKIFQKNCSELIEELGLPPLEEDNSDFVGSTIEFQYKETLDTGKFNDLKETIKKYINYGFIESRDTKFNDYEFIFKRGIIEYDLNKYDNIDVVNMYSHLTNKKDLEVWDRNFDLGRIVKVNLKATYVEFLILNIRRNEFEIFLFYLKNMLANITFTKTRSIAQKVNRIKKLIQIDPELYKIYDPKTGNLIFSRLCQKDHQPDIITKDDEQFKKLKETDGKIIKYKNFTTGEDVYYKCSTAKYPYMGFISDKHPKKYCIPCCQKIDLSKTEGKKAEQYKQCAKNKTTEIEKESSSYILKYGKTLPKDRLGHLPNIFNVDNYFLYGIGNVKSLLSSIAFSLDKTLDTLINEIYINIEKMRLCGSFNSPSEFLREFEEYLDDTKENISMWDKEILNLVNKVYSVSTIIISQDGNNFESGYMNYGNYIILSYDGLNYNPVISADKNNFQLTKHINKKLFTQSDSIVQLFLNAKKNAYIKSMLNLDILIEFSKNLYGTSWQNKILQYVSYDICYGLEINNEILIPLNEKWIDSIKKTNELYLRKNASAYNKTLNVIQLLNNFIKEKQYDPIIFTKWIEYKNSIIGGITNIGAIYFRNINIKLLPEAQILTLYEDPDVINKKIVSKLNEDKFKDRKFKAYYEYYKYQIFRMHFISVIEDDINKPIRNKLINFIKSTNFLININEKRAELQNISNDSDLMKHFDSFYIDGLTKEEFIDMIKESRYDFDYITFNNLTNMDNTKLLQEVKKLMGKIVIFKSVKDGDMNINNLDICDKDEEIPYCVGKKMILNKKDFDPFCEILSNEIKNPYMQKYFVGTSNLKSVIDFLSFDLEDHENISVSINS